MFAANMFEQELQSSAIAKSLNVHPQTVRRWRRDYNVLGREGLDSHKHPGSKPRLTPQQHQRLAELLLLSPVQCGFERYLWTTSLIADLIRREFSVSYHHDTIGFLMRDLGFSWQKPACRAKERDKVRIEAWRSEVWPEILKKSIAESGVILAADEVGFMMMPSIKKTWAPIGKTPLVHYRNRHRRKVSVLGAVALQPATGQFQLLCDFYPDSYVRSEQCASFLHRVLAEYPTGPIDLIWDNLAAHKSPIVKEVLAQHPRLTLHYLPPYSPDLNPQEGIWSLAKYHRMANHNIDELDDLHSEAARHLREIGEDQALLKSCFQGAGLVTAL